MLRSASLLLVALVSIAAASCAPASDSEPSPVDTTSHDPDVKFLVGEVEIRGTEVQALADAVQAIHPEYAANHCRRIALGNTLLPRAAMASYWPEAREAARTASLQALEEVRAAGPLPPADSAVHSGIYADLGLDLWAFARALEPNEWSGPFESEGIFYLVRLLQVSPGPKPPGTELLSIELQPFPYAPATANANTRDEAISAATLTILDPEWRDLVPESYRYRMGEVNR